MFMILKYGIEEIMNLGSEKFIKDNGQDITRNKTGKKQFCRQGPGVFNHRSQEILHVLVLADDGYQLNSPGRLFIVPGSGNLFMRSKCGRFTINLYFCIPELVDG